MEKRTKRYRKGNIFHYSEGSRCKRIWCATNCAAKGQRDTVMVVFFSPHPRLYSFNLAKRMDCRDSKSEISQNEKQKEILLYKQVEMIYLFIFHVVVGGDGGGAGSCFPRCCAVIAAFLFFCYLDLVPECDVATSVSQMISCLLGLPAR